VKRHASCRAESACPGSEQLLLHDSPFVKPKTLTGQQTSCFGIYFSSIMIMIMIIINVDGVRFYLRTAATNGPIVHPPGDM
jgi:hypothetical protein